MPRQVQRVHMFTVPSHIKYVIQLCLCMAHFPSIREVLKQNEL